MGQSTPVLYCECRAQGNLNTFDSYDFHVVRIEFDLAASVHHRLLKPEQIQDRKRPTAGAPVSRGADSLAAALAGLSQPGAGFFGPALRGGLAAGKNNDLGTKRHSIEEFDDIDIQHADAA
jgi:hypothetical protein